MNERERWIVYPLLFLALGAALRDKLSEQTKTKRIECQELIVFGEEGVNRTPVPLVQIGAMQRSSGDAPHIGQVLINGQLIAQGVQADSFQARNVNADNYYFRRVPFAPALLRAMPGVSPADWLRALQQSAQSLGPNSQSTVTPPAKSDEARSSAESAGKMTAALRRSAFTSGLARPKALRCIEGDSPPKATHIRRNER